MKERTHESQDESSGLGDELYVLGEEPGAFGVDQLSQFLELRDP